MSQDKKDGEEKKKLKCESCAEELEKDHIGVRCYNGHHLCDDCTETCIDEEDDDDEAYMQAVDSMEEHFRCVERDVKWGALTREFAAALSSREAIHWQRVAASMVKVGDFEQDLEALEALQGEWEDGRGNVYTLTLNKECARALDVRTRFWDGRVWFTPVLVRLSSAETWLSGETWLVFGTREPFTAQAQSCLTWRRGDAVYQWRRLPASPFE